MEADPLKIPAKLRVAALDDDDVIRLIDKKMYASLGFEAVVLGKNREEIAGFPEYVCAMCPPPHLVVLDQNLNPPTSGERYILGTQLIAPLRAAGFTGKIVIKSANQSSEDRALYQVVCASPEIRTRDGHNLRRAISGERRRRLVRQGIGRRDIQARARQGPQGDVEVELGAD